MPPNSQLRRAAKQGLARLEGTGSYRYLQAASKAWDIRRGTWTEPELEIIAHAVKPGDTALDLGANFGLWTYHLGRAVGDSGRVLAFEPIPYTFGVLKTVTRVLRVGNAELFALGCGDRSHTVTFRAPLQDSGALSAGQVHFADRRDDRPGKEQQVRWSQTAEIKADVIALDEFLPPLRDLSFVKADIEGAEVFAFKGARRLLAEHRPTVVCEINPWYLEGFDQSVAELVGLFADEGYQLYRYGDDGPHRLHAVSRAEDVTEDNYVFVHPSRSEPLRPLLA